MTNLPDVHQAILDDATLQSLVDDVNQFGSDIEIIEKTGARQLVESKPITLEEMHTSLVAGRLRAAQVRYDFDGQRWCDTITRATEGFRLTRISLTTAAAATMVSD